MHPKNALMTKSCELLNRHELSRSQERALQRFIEQNAHLIADQRSSPNEHTAQVDLVQSRECRRSTTQSNRRIPSAGVLRHNHSPALVERSRSVGFLDSSNSSEHRTQAPRPLYNTTGASKKKEVKWSDVEQQVSKANATEQRAHSLSPDHTRKHPSELSSSPAMMHYGSAGNINDRWFSHEPPHHHQAIRDRTASPAYSSLDRHLDDYNRYETARHSHTKNIQRTRHDEESDRSRFSGYGDRPGSGVEFAPSKWHGGEIITDRRQLPKSLKPRRIYYSPIGDGVVAADGLEMKRQPKDMSPRISVTQTRVVERGADPGRDGYNLYEKHLTHSGAASEYDSEYGGAGGGGTSGRNSRSTGAFSPSGDSYVGMGGGAGTLQYSPGSVGAASGGAGALAGAAPGHGSESGLGSGQLPGPPRGEYHRSGAVTPKHVQHAPPSTYHHAQRERDYGNEPLGDIYPLSGSASCAPRYMPAGGGITGSGVGRFYSSNTPTPTNSPLAAEVYGSSAPASNYTTLASRAAAGTADHPSATFHSAHHSESCYTSDYKATRSRSHDPATDGFDGLSAAGGYAGSGGGGAGGPHYYGGAGMDGRSSAASGYSYSLRTDSPRRYDTLSTDYLITNPRELIHQYATTTPVAVLDVNNVNDSLSRGNARAAAYTNSMAATTTEERYAPYPPYKGSETTVHPNNFVRQLRDENLTISQREANRHMEPLNPKGSNYEQKIYELRNRTTTKGGTNMGDEIDYLTERMMYGLQTGHPTPPQL